MTQIYIFIKQLCQFYSNVNSRQPTDLGLKPTLVSATTFVPLFSVISHSNVMVNCMEDRYSSNATYKYVRLSFEYFLRFYETRFSVSVFWHILSGYICWCHPTSFGSYSSERLLPFRCVFNVRAEHHDVILGISL